MRPSTKTTRRDFLQRVAATGAALAVPSIIPSGVLAAPGRLGANDQIAIGAIGVGRRAEQLLAELARLPGNRVVAVADVNVVRARQVADRLGAEAYQDYRQLLERKDVDAIVTATPDHWRSLVCIHACQAGKDVYAEKPLTVTIREGRRIVEAARKYSRVFQTGSQQRSMAANRLGCELIRNGRIGKVRRVIAHNYPSPWEYGLSAQPVPVGLDWDVWCGPVEVVPYHADLYAPRANPGWISFRLFSGGEMTGWGSHGLDQVQWALGMDDGGPIEVWTEGEKLVPPKYAKPESKARGDQLCGQPKVFFRYPGDIVMELGDGPDGGAIFVGEKGTITIDRGKCLSDPVAIAAEPIRSSDIRLARSDHHMRNWLDCIRSRQRPVADVEVGHRSATVCHLGNIARALGRHLRWDPVQEVFVGDNEANTFLDRPRRKPYQLPEKV
jgi:predicted dehydrogenase